mgnify:CR=1 FL=1|jgi:hypothetical protein|tara:strand:+ start:7598 stop:7777 length:180 start_codon:yes stop_codon:yes gene_type:complete
MSAVSVAMDKRRLCRTHGLAVALLVIAAMMAWSVLSSADAGRQAGRVVGERGGALFIND